MAGRALVLASTATVLALSACKRDDDVNPIEDTLIEEVVELPTLELTTPGRAAFLGERSVTVSGQAQAGTHALESLTISDQDVTLSPAGAFEASWSPVVGINILGARLEDVGGERAVDGRAFVWGPVHDPGARLDSAMRLLLGPDLSELSDIIELVLADSSIASDFVGQTMETDYADITITSFSWNGADASLTPGNGALRGSFVLYDVWMDFTADIVGWVEVDGSAWMDSLSLDADVELRASGGTVTATATSVEATLSGFGMEVDWVPSWAEDWLADWAADYVASSLEEEVAAMLEELVPEYMAGLAMDFSFGDPPIDFALSMDSLEVTTGGVRLEMDASVSGATAIELPTGAGSIDTSESPPAWSEAAGGNFAVMLDDDLLNQVFFAIWSSGMMSSLSIGNLELGVLMGEQMDPPLGPVESLVIDLQLPAMVSQPTQDDMQFDLTLGELWLHFHREDGITHSFSVNTRAGGSASFEQVEGEQQVVIGLDDRPAYLDVDVGVMAWDPALDPGDLAALVRLIVPPLLGRSAEFMPGVAVPPLEMSEYTDMEALQGVTMELDNPEISTTDAGWLVVRGDYTAQ